MKNEYVSMNYYGIKLSSGQFEKLRAGLCCRFMFLDNQPHCQSVTLVGEHLAIRFSETGRSLFADERSEAFPNRIGKETKIDTLRRNEVGAYVGGFLQAVSVV